MSKTYAENLVCVFDLSNNRNNTKLVLMADQEKCSGNTVWMCLISTFCFQLHFLFPGPDIMIILRKQLSHRLDKHNIKHIWLCYTAHFNSSNHPQHLLVVLTISLVSLSATIALHGEKSMRVLRVVLFEVCFWLIIPHYEYFSTKVKPEGGEWSDTFPWSEWSQFRAGVKLQWMNNNLESSHHHLSLWLWNCDITLPPVRLLALHTFLFMQ